MIHGQKRSHEVPAIFLPKGLLILLGFSAVFSLLYPSFTPWGILPFNGLYGEAPADGGYLCKGFGRYMKGQGFYLLKYMKGQRNLSFSACKKTQKSHRCILSAAKKSRKHFGFVINKFFINSGFTAVKRDVKF